MLILFNVFDIILYYIYFSYLIFNLPLRVSPEPSKKRNLPTERTEINSPGLHSMEDCNVCRLLRNTFPLLIH